MSKLLQALPYLCVLVAAAMFPGVLNKIFLDTPIEATMGTAQKIFYFHVPLAWVFMLFAMGSGIAAIVEIRKGSMRAQALALAQAEMVVLTGVGVLITGPIWGDATWGRPWTGDARQVSTALLWLIFVAYLLLRRYGPAHADRLAAGLAAFAVVLVPLTYQAVKIWKTTHPNTTVVASLPAPLWEAFWPALEAIFMVSITLIAVRYQQERVEQQLDEQWVEFEETKQEQNGANPVGANP